MPLNRDEVRQIATLARLRLTPQDELELPAQLEQIVTYIDRLPELPDAASAGGPAGAGEAEDRVAPCLPRAVVLANAPAVRGGLVRVPAALAGEGDD